MSRIDQAPRYAPSTVLVRGVPCPVRAYTAHSPGKHPAGCPIAPEFTALEMVTDRGSRWYGFEKAWINSELRMVVSGFAAADTVRARWERCEV